MEEMLKKLHYLMAAKARQPRRREGFPGQHLVVLPRPELTTIQRDPLLRDLFPTASGRFPKAAGHFVERRAGIDDFILIHVLEGEGWVKVGRTQQLAAGQFFLIGSGAAHAYGADDSNPWAIEWIHFQGASAASFAELFGPETEGDPLYVYPGKVERLDFSSVYGRLELGYMRGVLLAAAASLRLILTELSSLAESSVRSTSTEAVFQSLLWMKQNVGARSSLAQLARRAKLSVPHYSALFRRATGFSPMDYFLRLKIQKACQLLDTTALRVSEIAAAVGWDDPFYFSRFFRKITGKPPRAYRAIAKG